MKEVAARYKVEYNTLTSFFHRDMEAEKEVLYNSLEKFLGNISFQIYELWFARDNVCVHFDIYYPKELFESDTHILKLFTSNGFNLINVYILEVREQEN